MGNPKVRCGKQRSCSCSGDPHCHQFDGSPFEFQGRCTYDFVTTECHNRDQLVKLLNITKFFNLK